jgi:hypothetical protein
VGILRVNVDLSMVIRAARVVTILLACGYSRLADGFSRLARGTFEGGRTRLFISLVGTISVSTTTRVLLPWCVRCIWGINRALFNVARRKKMKGASHL